MNVDEKNTAFRRENGILISDRAFMNFREFEQNYLKVRNGEQRVLSDELAAQLPFIPASHPDHRHWSIRRKNLDRLSGYLRSRTGLRILDAGCGNGFLSAMMARLGHQVSAMDVNVTELTQAARVFPDLGIKWYCADIFEDSFPEKFDLLVFCCSVQYFPSLRKTLERAKNLLGPEGEIHIIDSPFYRASEVRNAAERSRNYYVSQGISAMTVHYHHHTIEELNEFSPHYMYKPSLLTRLMKDSPFPWIIILK